MTQPRNFPTSYFYCEESPRELYIFAKQKSDHETHISTQCYLCPFGDFQNQANFASFTFLSLICRYVTVADSFLCQPQSLTLCTICLMIGNSYPVPFESGTKNYHQVDQSCRIIQQGRFFCLFLPRGLKSLHRPKQLQNRLTTSRSEWLFNKTLKLSLDGVIFRK